MSDFILSYLIEKIIEDYLSWALKTKNKCYVGGNVEILL